MFKSGVSLWLSAASAWELVIKFNAGRLKLGKPPEEAIAQLIDSGFQTLPITVRHALAIGALPSLHADPFDRILVAQSQCEGLTIVTVDSAITSYDVRTI